MLSMSPVMPRTWYCQSHAGQAALIAGPAAARLDELVNRDSTANCRVVELVECRRAQFIEAKKERALSRTAFTLSRYMRAEPSRSDICAV